MQITISIFFVCLCLNLQAQKNCAKYNEAMKKGHEYFNKKKYDTALIEFQAAQIAARECSITAKDPADEIKKVFKGLQAQKDDAVTAKKEAEKQKAIADIKTKEAIAQKEANQTQLARNYWNNSQSARAENNLLEALHFTVEALAITKNKDITKNLLVDIETYLPATCLKLILSHGARLNSALFSPDGKKILTLGKEEYGFAARLWDAETAKQVGLDMPMHENYSGIEPTAVFSPDGKWILIVGSDTTVRLWDVAAAKSTELLLHINDTANGTTYKDNIQEAIFSPNGQRILTISRSTVCVWDRATGERIGNAIVPEDFNHSWLFANFSPDGKQILTTSDTTVRLWNADTGEQLGADVNYKDPGRIISAVFSPDGKYILTANGYLLKTATTGLDSSYMELEGYVRSAVFSKSGKLIVITTLEDEIVRISYWVWYPGTGLPKDVVIKNTSYIQSVSLSPDEKKVLTSNWDNADLWDARTGKQLGSAKNFGSNVKIVVFSPDNNHFLTANEDGTVRVWDIKIRDTVSAIKYLNIKTAIFNQNGKQLLTISSDQHAQLLIVETGKLLSSDMQNEESVTTAIFSPDGKEILTVSLKGNIVRLWSAKTGKRIGKDMVDTNEVESASFSSNGKEILTITGFTDPLPATPTRKPIITHHYINLWDAGTGRRISFPKIEIETAVLSPKENHILTTSETVRLYNISNGKQFGHDSEYNNPSTRPHDALFSPDGKYILTLNDNGYAIMWKAGKGNQPIFTIKHSESILSAVFSPNGKYILTIGNDKTARLWEARKGGPVGPAMKHEEIINTAVFSPDGKHILTSADKTVRMWETGTGKQIGPSIDHDKEVNKAFFTPDGTKILTITNKDSTVRLWNLEGDLDLPSNLLKLQTEVSTGYELNLQTNELQLVPSEHWYKLKQEYNIKAREHYKICKYREYNFWSRFYPEEARKLRL